MATRKREKKNK